LDNDHFFYHRSANALVMLFICDIDFYVATTTDADNVPVTTTVSASSIGVEIRFGHLLLENSFGLEILNLAHPIQLEHFDGSDFIASIDNNCMSYDVSRILLTNISLDSAATNILSVIGNYLSGKATAIEFEAPGDGNQG
jgi:hypothetical protein